MRGVYGMIAAVVLGGCAAPKPSDEAANTKAQQTTRSLSAQARQAVADGALLLDVRTPDEFAQGHVSGAVNIPVDQLRARLDEVGAKERTIVLYCRSGRRSATAATMLKTAGYQSLLDIGPMDAWHQP